MDEKLASAGKDVLVQIVKLAQKRGMKGEKGGWKEFLSVYDKKFGASMSDPAKRNPEALRAFLQTFKSEEDLQFLAKMFKCHSNRELVKQVMKSQDDESPEQRLVRLTLEHPLYPIEYSLPSHEEGWLVTKLGKRSNLKASNTLLAVDCEMVLCEDGTEALVRLCVVDRNLEVKLDEFVKPDKAVADYRTQITDVSEEDLDGVTCSLADVQRSLKRLLSHGTILVGHSLSNDLKALKVDHARVIDTSFIFKYGDGSARRRPSLNDLCKSVLGYELRKKDAPHNCVHDACAAMKLVVAKIEKGFDDVIPPVQDDTPDSEKAKLFLHRIPKGLPSEELHKLIPGDFSIEVQPNKKGRGDKYSALAIFGNPQEALDAYEKLQGDEVQDPSGRSQKPISVELKSGSTDIIFARKMHRDNHSPAQVSAKRSHDPTELTDHGESKKLKTEQSLEASQEGNVDYVKEIERLDRKSVV